MQRSLLAQVVPYQIHIGSIAHCRSPCLHYPTSTFATSTLPRSMLPSSVEASLNDDFGDQSNCNLGYEQPKAERKSLKVFFMIKLDSCLALLSLEAFLVILILFFLFLLRIARLIEVVIFGINFEKIGVLII